MLVSARLQGKAGKAVGPSSVADSKLCERKRKQEENRNGTIAHSGKNRICFQRENESSAPACFSTCNFLTRLSTLSGSSCPFDQEHPGLGLPHLCGEQPPSGERDGDDGLVAASKPLPVGGKVCHSRLSAIRRRGKGAWAWR